MMESNNDRNAFIVVGLGNGDEGKGTITDFLVRARRAHTVIRFNGGGQAAHKVVLPNGTQHVFSQFGSGTFVPGVRTHLSQHFILNPLSMMVENDHLKSKGVGDAFARTTISKYALVTTPFQRAANRLREFMRGEARHGSCGVGIGETVDDSFKLGNEAIRAGDLSSPTVLRLLLCRVQEFKREQLKDLLDQKSHHWPNEIHEAIAWLEEPRFIQIFLNAIASFNQLAYVVDSDYQDELMKKDGSVVFEGAQGVLLDEWRGFHPYTTWSACTFDNALEVMNQHGYDGEVTRIGVVRAYGTRHGPGPFVTEDSKLTAALPDTNNTMSQWQREFRVGWFDAVATKYAIEVCNGIDGLAVTCLDRLAPVPEWKICTGYVPLTSSEMSENEIFFQFDDNHENLATDINLGKLERDLTYQNMLTDRLMKARPRYELTSRSAYPDRREWDHLERISSELGTPVLITSNGPTHKEKQFHL